MSAVEVKPPDVHTDVMTVCTSRPRGCHRFKVERCRSCRWWGHVPEEGEMLDLFDPQHDAELCARRQREPEWARQQDRERMAAAGVPVGDLP